MVGGRDFVESAALATFENNADHLPSVDSSDQRVIASSALVALGASSLEGGVGGVADKNASGPLFGLRNCLHTICRFLVHGF